MMKKEKDLNRKIVVGLTCPAVSTNWRLKSWPFTDTILLKA